MLNEINRRADKAQTEDGIVLADVVALLTFGHCTCFGNEIICALYQREAFTKEQPRRRKSAEAVYSNEVYQGITSQQSVWQMEAVLEEAGGPW